MSADALATIDLAAWVGQYPFRGIPNSSLQHLEDKLGALRIERAVVSPFEAIFWENNLDAFRAWIPRLASHARLELWPVVNPAMPGQLAELEALIDEHRAAETGGPRGIRLLPGYHGYSPLDPAVDECMAFAREHGLIVQVFQQIADPRWHWMLHVPPVPVNELAYLAARHPAQRILISGLNNPQALADRLRIHPTLYVDLSRIRGPVFGVERLLEQIPADRVVFGSLWPIQITEATHWQVIHADIPASTRAALLRDNALRLLADTPDDESHDEHPPLRAELDAL